MAQGDVALLPPGLSADELGQIREFEKIVRFRDAVVAGTHPRVKMPSHLAPSKAAGASFHSLSSSNAPPSSADRSAPLTTTKSAAANTGASVSGLQKKKKANLDAFQANSHHLGAPAPAPTPVPAPALVDLPGLGAAVASDPRRVSEPQASSVPPLFSSGRAEIDPIFLEKSEDLIRAEIQLQRTRAEKALREQLEQHRSASKPLLQASDPLPDFDVTQVWQTALALVKSTAPAAAAADAAAAANKSIASDSFDDNTFYSSTFETPDSHLLARVPIESDDDDVQMRESSEYEPELDVDVPLITGDPPVMAVEGAVPVAGTPLQASAQAASVQAYSTSGLHGSQAVGAAHHALQRSTAVGGSGSLQGGSFQAISSQESGEASGSGGESGNTDYDQSTDEARLQRRAADQQLFDSTFARPASPFVRAHDLSPVAPQPAHVSPLATARQALPATQEGHVSRGTPPQVAALRKGQPAISSPESSPYGAAKGPEKKRGKKKNKRKADRQTVDAAASPYIKPEPRSPSPMSAPSFSRPQKRRKQGQGTAQEVTYDEPRYELSANDDYHDRARYLPGSYRDDRVSVVYERPDDRYASRQPPVPPRSIIVQEPAHQDRREFYDDRRPPPQQPEYIRRAPEPDAYSIEYATQPIRPARVTSHTLPELPSSLAARAPAGHRETYDVTPAGVSRGVDRDRSRSPVMRPRTPLMTPAARHQQPPRIVMDEFGREYIEPARPPPQALRQSVLPPPRAAEREIIYERIPQPVRASSRMPETFEEDGVIYKRAPAAYAEPRRIVTQPEYAAAEYRTNYAPNPRGYSMRPVPTPSDGYLHQQQQQQQPAPPERRLPEELRRDYIARASSVRPPEPIRYELARGYERYGSVRPEIPLVKYTSGSYPEVRQERVPSGHPDVRREVLDGRVTTEYSARPEAQVVQRAYSVRPAEQGYYPPNPYRRGDEEVTYIERPRASEQEIVFSDNSRRDVYR